MEKAYWDQLFKNRKVDIPPEEFLVDHINLLKKGTLLDLACGDGRNALFLCRKGFSVTGADYSQQGLSRLKTKAQLAGSPIETKCLDLTDLSALKELPFFDNILSNHYIPSLKSLPVIQSKLKKGGRLILVGFLRSILKIRKVPEYLIFEDEIFERLSESMELLKEYSWQDDRGEFRAAVYTKKKTGPSGPV